MSQERIGITLDITTNTDLQSLIRDLERIEESTGKIMGPAEDLEDVISPIADNIADISTSFNRIARLNLLRQMPDIEGLYRFFDQIDQLQEDVGREVTISDIVKQVFEDIDPTVFVGSATMGYRSTSRTRELMERGEEAGEAIMSGIEAVIRTAMFGATIEPHRRTRVLGKIGELLEDLRAGGAHVGGLVSDVAKQTGEEAVRTLTLNMLRTLPQEEVEFEREKGYIELGENLTNTLIDDYGDIIREIFGQEMIDLMREQNIMTGVGERWRSFRPRMVDFQSRLIGEIREEWEGESEETINQIIDQIVPSIEAMKTMDIGYKILGEGETADMISRFLGEIGNVFPFSSKYGWIPAKRGMEALPSRDILQRARELGFPEEDIEDIKAVALEAAKDYEDITVRLADLPGMMTTSVEDLLEGASVEIEDMVSQSGLFDEMRNLLTLQRENMERIESVLNQVINFAAGTNLSGQRLSGTAGEGTTGDIPGPGTSDDGGSTS